jgi:hypothetical protein
MPGKFPPGERCADIVVRPWQPGVAQGAGATLQATLGERDIGGNADVADRDALGDPVVGGIRLIGREPLCTTKTASPARAATR